MQIRKILSFVEEVRSEAGRPAAPPLRKVAVAAIITNPYAGRWVDDLGPLTDGQRGARPRDHRARRLAAEALRAGKLRQGRDHRACRRAAARLGDADDRVRQRHARGGRRRHGVDLLVHQARSARRDDRHSARPQGRALRPLALRRHLDHAARRAAAGRARDHLRLRQPRPAQPPHRRPRRRATSRARTDWFELASLEIASLQRNDPSTPDPPSRSGVNTEPAMSNAPCKTGAEHLASLRDGRNVYLNGKQGRRRHHASRVPQLLRVRRRALRFPGAARERRDDDVPARGRHAAHQSRVVAAAQPRRDGQPPQGAAGVGRRAATASSAARRIISRPCSSARASAWTSGTSTIPSAPRRSQDYFQYASRNDLFLTYVIINPQADRSKDWGDQVEELVAQVVDEDSEGITIRGAKMLGTSSIMANEVFVANLQPLKPGEEKLAFSCALPMNAKGLKVLSRKSYEQHAVSVYDNPLSVALRRERRADVLRRREGAVGSRVRAQERRDVLQPVPRHAGPRLPELPGADPPVA